MAARVIFRSMTEGSGSRWGLVGGVAGGVIGGFTWVVVAGVLIGDPAVWLAAILAAAIVCWTAWRLYARQPATALLVVGWTVLLVCVLDLAFLAWVLPRLPAERAGLWLGTDRAAFAAVRPWAVVGSISGAVVALWAMWRRRSV